jgi:uncharacterized protein YraI
LKRRLLSALVLASIAFALVGAQTTPEPTPTPVPGPRGSVVIVGDVYVRGGPGRDYVPVGRLVEGDSLTPLSRNMAGDWVLIVYRDGYGWIRRDLGAWVEDIDPLPVMLETDLTPSPIPGRNTPRPFFPPTETPTGNWVLIRGAESAYVRAGPGRTYLRLGQLFDGDVVEPVGRNADTTWIMIRFGDGYGWILRSLVRWIDDLERLPVVAETNLTPSPTFTSTNTPTQTFTPTNTPTETPTATATETPVPTDTATNTLTPTPSETVTLTPTNTATDLPTATLTWTPTALPTITETVTPTDVPSSTPSVTTAPTNTDEPTAVAQAAVPSETPIVPGITPSLTPTSTVTLTAVPSEPATLTETPVPTPTATRTAIPPSDTPLATDSQTATSIPTETNTSVPSSDTLSATNTLIPPSATREVVTLTSTALAGAIVATVAPPTVQTPTSEPAAPDSGRFPIEALVGGATLLFILAYIGLYVRGLLGAERYAKGFALDRCPVCYRGELTIEARDERILGIPRVRRTVHCSNCRSVLREIGDRRWRYAVDPIENPALYERYNGREIDDDTLRMLANQPVTPDLPPTPRPPSIPPAFVDDEDS